MIKKRNKIKFMHNRLRKYNFSKKKKKKEIKNINFQYTQKKSHDWKTRRILQESPKTTPDSDQISARRKGCVLQARNRPWTTPTVLFFRGHETENFGKFPWLRAKLHYIPLHYGYYSSSCRSLFVI